MITPSKNKKGKYIMLIRQFRWLLFLIGLLSSFSYSQVSFRGDKPIQKDISFLTTYIQDTNPSQQQIQQAIKIIKQAQYFQIYFEGDYLNQDTVWRKQVNNDWVNVEQIGKSGVSIIIRPFNEKSPSFTSNSPSTEKILEYIRQPVSAGYQPRSGYIAYIPSLEVKTTTFDKCKPIIKKIAYDLYELKTSYKQLQNYDTTNAYLGSWEAPYKSYPRYPGISYRYGIGKEIPNTKGVTEKTTENWCEIALWVKPADGQLDPRVYPRITYPRQGITVCWYVYAEIENKKFIMDANKIIRTDLQPLNDYENELEQKQQ
jgi:hypothetical protein